ncbi:MAG: hypothetical protein GF344_10020 [Chitinivibrionales bacterium]|nr:hypothetical protein [Chitinivibrionales bacterium]MBD3357170.1 hypothetical protein [Chitinivibrionales bacterium]
MSQYSCRLIFNSTRLDIVSKNLLNAVRCYPPVVGPGGSGGSRDELLAGGYGCATHKISNGAGAAMDFASDRRAAGSQGDRIG